MLLTVSTTQPLLQYPRSQPCSHTDLHFFPGTTCTFKSSSSSLSGDEAEKELARGVKGPRSPLAQPRTHGPPPHPSLSLRWAAQAAGLLVMFSLNIILCFWHRGWKRSNQLARPLAFDCGIDCAPHALRLLLLLGLLHHWS